MPFESRYFGVNKVDARVLYNFKTIFQLKQLERKILPRIFGLNREEEGEIT